MAARFLSVPQRELRSSSRSSWRAPFQRSMSVSAPVRRRRMAVPPVRWERTRPSSHSRHRTHALWRWCPREVNERSSSHNSESRVTCGAVRFHHETFPAHSLMAASGTLRAIPEGPQDLITGTMERMEKWKVAVIQGYRYLGDVENHGYRHMGRGIDARERCSQDTVAPTEPC